MPSHHGLNILFYSCCRLNGKFFYQHLGYIRRKKSWQGKQNKTTPSLPPLIQGLGLHCWSQILLFVMFYILFSVNRKKKQFCLNISIPLYIQCCLHHHSMVMPGWDLSWHVRGARVLEVLGEIRSGVWKSSTVRWKWIVSQWIFQPLRWRSCTITECTPTRWQLKWLVCSHTPTQ